MIFRRVVHEYTWCCGDHGSGGSQHCLNAARCRTLPVRADHQVEAGLGCVLLTDPRKFVGACVIKRVDPEAVAEVGNLEDDGSLIQTVKEAETIYNVLIWAGDETLLRP